MFRLTSKLNTSFDFEGKEIHLLLSFDRVLSMFEVFQDPLFNPYEKIDIALEILVVEYDEVETLSIEEKNKLLLFIMDEFLGMDTDNNSSSNEKKIFDFIQDAGIIFASFYHAYGIDLIEQQGKLDWRKFIQLFNHLDDRSKIKEIMNIRNMPVPSSKKGNEEYRKQILKMKQIYSLDQPQSEEESEEKLNNAFDQLANTFIKK